MSNRSTAEYLEVKDRAFEAFSRLPGVHAVGLGRNEVAGHSGDHLALRVFLSKKKPLTALDRKERIPPSYEGIPTDVVEEPPPRLAVDGIVGRTDVLNSRTDSGRERPLIGGTQVLRVGKTAGTMGCFATVPGVPHRVFGLTNHHVVFDGPAAPFVAHQVGQPTGRDSCTGCSRDIFGRVASDANSNNVDIVLIEVEAGQKWKADVKGIGNVTGQRNLTLADAAARNVEVQKRGRTTGHTGGILWDFACNTTISGRTYRDLHRILAHDDPNFPTEASSFISAGDSGSALLDMDRKVCGIMVADPGLLGLGGVTGDCPFAFGNPATHTAQGLVAFAIPIQQIIGTFAPGLTIQIATAASSGEVRTVPSAAEAVALEGAMLNPNEVAERLEADLSRSGMGRWYRQLYLHHLEEVNNLIQGNRRVTTRWHRSGSAALFQSMVRSFHDPHRPLPTEIDGRPLPEIVLALYVVLNECGSSELRRDLHQVHPTLPDVSGMTYPQIIERLAASEHQQPPSLN